MEQIQIPGPSPRNSELLAVEWGPGMRTRKVLVQPFLPSHSVQLCTCPTREPQLMWADN